MKMKTNFWIVVIALIAGAVLTGNRLALASQATDDIKTTVDKVLNIVGDEKFKADKQARRAKMRDLINARFSYEQMGMRSLADEWEKLSPEQRKEFIDLFGKLLEHSYASKIESYRDEKINYTGEIIKDGYAMVKTEVVRKNDTIGVEYKLIKLNNQWLVYDFVIEGVSMIRNYRSQFTKIIHKDSFAGLIKKMNTKIADLDSDDKAYDRDEENANKNGKKKADEL